MNSTCFKLKYLQIFLLGLLCNNMFSQTKFIEFEGEWKYYYEKEAPPKDGKIQKVSRLHGKLELQQ